jgi:hypothetical protein
MTILGLLMASLSVEAKGMLAILWQIAMTLLPLGYLQAGTLCGIEGFEGHHLIWGILSLCIVWTSIIAIIAIFAIFAIFAIAMLMCILWWLYF